MQYIITNAFVHHFYIHCGHPHQKLGFYVDCGEGSVKETDFKQKSRKSRSENAFLRKRSPFPRIENLRQGVFGVL